MSLASQLTKFEAGCNDGNKIYAENLTKPVDGDPEVKKRKRAPNPDAVAKVPPHYDPSSSKNKRLAKAAERVVGKRRSKRKRAPEAVVISPERAIQRIKRAILIPEPPNVISQEHFRGYLRSKEAEKRSLWDLSCMVPELTSQEIMMLHDVDFDLELVEKAMVEEAAVKEDGGCQSSPVVVVMKRANQHEARSFEVDLIGTSMAYEEDALSSVCEIPETPNQRYEDICESDTSSESMPIVECGEIDEVPQSPYVVDFELFAIGEYDM